MDSIFSSMKTAAMAGIAALVLAGQPAHAGSPAHPQERTPSAAQQENKERHLELAVGYAVGSYSGSLTHGGIGRLRYGSDYYVIGGIYLGYETENESIAANIQLGCGLDFDISRDARIGLAVYPLAFVSVAGDSFYAPAAGVDLEILFGNGTVGLYAFPNAGALVGGEASGFGGLEAGIRGHF